MSGFAAQRGSCKICGASDVLVRLEMWRYLVFEPGAEYDGGDRCIDRALCRRDIDALHKADPTRPKWNVADGPAAVSRPATNWYARAGSTAPEPTEVAAKPAPAAVPANEEPPPPEPPAASELVDLGEAERDPRTAPRRSRTRRPTRGPSDRADAWW